MADKSAILQESAANLGVVLKTEQLSVCNAILEGSDVFATLPTGFGKSMCFQCLPQACDKLRGLENGSSIVLVVTPLIAIMEDQVKDAVRKGLTAECVSSSTSPDIKRRVIQGYYQLVFIVPELLLSKTWKRIILNTDVFQTNLITVVFDEAHCISKWYVYNFATKVNFYITF